MKSRAPIYAEQYVEVIRNKENTWDVELVIETINKESSPLRQNLATFDTEEEAQVYGNKNFPDDTKSYVLLRKEIITHGE